LTSKTNIYLILKNEFLNAKRNKVNIMKNKSRKKIELSSSPAATNENELSKKERQK
jgi:hypothetical protein